MAKLTPPINDDDHVLGNSEALVTLVEYGDYQCPHCGRAFPIVKQIQKKFGKKLRFVFRHFPLSNIHQYALPAAIAAEAAARQQKFWEMHDAIFENQFKLSESALPEFAMEIGLNASAFKKDLQDAALAEKVESNFESGIKSGVNGTPSFFINGSKHNADFDYETLASAIEEKMQLQF